MLLPSFLRKRPRIRFEDLSESLAPHELPPLDRPGLSLDGLTADQAQWVETGVVVKKSFIPDSLLDPYIARRATFRPGTRQHNEGWVDPNCYEGVPELREIALYPPLMALLKSLMGEEMFLHLALTGWVSSERDWHQDDYLNPDFVKTWYLAVWIALETITPDSGPFQYVQGSHRWPLMRRDKVRGFLTEEELGRKEAATNLNQWPKYAERFVTPAIDEKIRASGLPIVTYLPRKGDVLVWHSRLMHRGSMAVEYGIPRRALIVHYSGVNHRPDMPVREQDANGQSYAVFRNQLTLE